jgi:two-component system, NarL family, response regulator FusR
MTSDPRSQGEDGQQLMRMRRLDEDVVGEVVDIGRQMAAGHQHATCLGYQAGTLDQHPRSGPRIQPQPEIAHDGVELSRGQDGERLVDGPRENDLTRPAKVVAHRPEQRLVVVDEENGGRMLFWRFHSRRRVRGDAARRANDTQRRRVSGQSAAWETKRRVFLVDDHAVVREGLAFMLDGTDDFTCCGQAANPSAALDQLEEHSPDLMVIDLRLGNESGLALVSEVRRRLPHLPVLVLSMHDEGVWAERALRAGANGYVMKSEPGQVVLDAMREVASGGSFLSGAMVARAVERLGEPPGARAPDSALTPRELQVFEMLGRGFGTRQIADALALGVKTVETHRYNIKNKLGLANANELVRHAILWVERTRDD